MNRSRVQPSESTGVLEATAKTEKRRERGRQTRIDLRTPYHFLPHAKANPDRRNERTNSFVVSCTAKTKKKKEAVFENTRRIRSNACTSYVSAGSEKVCQPQASTCVRRHAPTLAGHTRNRPYMRACVRAYILDALQQSLVAAAFLPCTSVGESMVGGCRALGCRRFLPPPADARPVRQRAGWEERFAAQRSRPASRALSHPPSPKQTTPVPLAALRTSPAYPTLPYRTVPYPTLFGSISSRTTTTVDGTTSECERHRRLVLSLLCPFFPFPSLDGTAGQTWGKAKQFRKRKSRYAGRPKSTNQPTHAFGVAWLGFDSI